MHLWMFDLHLDNNSYLNFQEIEILISISILMVLGFRKCIWTNNSSRPKTNDKTVVHCSNSVKIWLFSLGYTAILLIFFSTLFTSKCENNEEIEMLREYSQIPSVHPNIMVNALLELFKLMKSGFNLFCFALASVKFVYGCDKQNRLNIFENVLVH